MNRTFKVVFNKVRGALTVVNEVASSIQAKGSKTILVTSCALVGSLALSAHSAEISFSADVTGISGDQGGVQKVTGEDYLVVKDDITFSDNSGTLSGGVFSVTDTKNPSTIGNGVTFENNKSDAQGGALHLQRAEGTQIAQIGDNVKFIGNQAGSYAGGAIYQESYTDKELNEFGSSLSIGKNAYFEGNKSTTSHGGAIFNFGAGTESKIEVGSGAEFVENESAKTGGAISNWGATLSLGQNAKFEGNTSKANGGAIYNSGYEYYNYREGEVAVADGAVFSSNQAVGNGGAIYNDVGGIFSLGGLQAESTLTGNSAVSGGAIFNAGELNVVNTTFKDNNATSYGGAVAGSVDGKGQVTIDSGKFEGNTADAGGAIALWSDGSSDSAAKLKISGTRFVENSADRKGGAIVFLKNHSGDKIKAQATIDNASFEKNTAGMTGGALHLEYVDATISNSTFEGNTAVENGGAIYVADNATLTLEGENAFSGNMVGEKANDIYSEGTIAVQSGKTTLNGGLVLAGEATVTIGSDASSATLEVENLEMAEGTTIFLDPQEFGAVADASHLAVRNVNPITGGLIAGKNSLISLGVSSEEGIEAVSSMLAQNGLTWGKDVTSAVYLGSAVNITTGYVVADGSLTTGMTGAGTGNAGTLTVAKQGLLAANQTAVASGESLVTGTVSFEEGSTLAIVNATEGEFKLADNVAVADGAAVSVITDNPFYEAQLAANGSITTAQDTANGVSSIASAGLQAMTRRADFVLSQTVADRASIDQELQPGVNLWVDVSGENYQMDGMDYGAEFEADTFYGTFGGDVKLGDAYTLGAAFQYGDGSLRSSVNGVKNDVTNYGLALYGTAKFGAAKVVGELSYIWGENDITASQAALNQSVDTSIYSAGVTGMYELRAGGFSFIPSIGLRVSQLETDAMHVGDVSIEDQDQTLFQIPVALRINGADMNAGGWKLAPSFKIAYVPTFGDTEINVHNIEADVIDTSPVQMDLGLRAGTENLLLNATFSLGAGREGSSSVGGKIGLKYAF